MHTVRLLIGSLVVYVLVACGSAMLDQQQHPQQDAGSQIVDALTDPVGEAAGQSLPPITATESCSTMVPVAGGGVLAFAEHAFPGYSAQQLSGVRALATLSPAVLSAGGGLPGYSQVMGIGVYVRDGGVAVQCGNASSPTYASVTFILQP